PERLERIERNFQQYGVKILLFARMTPGIRAPIFITAGLTRLSLARFVLADGIYAIPGVSLLFFLGYWFTEGMVNLVREAAGKVKWIAGVVAVVGVAAYFASRFLRKPRVPGDPKEMPPLVEQVTHKLEEVPTKIIPPKSHAAPPAGRDQAHGGPPAPDGQIPGPPPPVKTEEARRTAPPPPPQPPP